MAAAVTILGIFVADLAFTAPRLPAIGETLLGQGFRIGPGGKGSNQAVAAARSGGAVRLISRLGQDVFGEIALRTWAEAGIDTQGVIRDPARPTGAAFIFVSSATGDNAIIVEPGAAAALTIADVRAAAPVIRSARVFLTQLEQPAAVAADGLALARAAGAITILNPAPAAPLDDATLALADVVTPNESEAALLTGLPVTSPAEATAAAEALIRRGASAAVITLGAAGALAHDGTTATHVPAFAVGPVVDTTGAGDAFAGAFAVALGEGLPMLAAIRFGQAAAGLSVTREGTAPAMPTRAAIEALLRNSI
jgi:ribokinase